MLQIKHIRKQYVTGDLVQTALDDVSLNFRDNEFVAILGPSGSGKTTMLNIIGGLDRYDSGDLIINGISTKQYKDRDWDSYRNHTIGFVFQSYNLIPHQTVLSNVELALTISGVSKSERRRRAKAALEQVGLGNQLHKKPNQMSGGQMQRVAIARALVNNPAILLADEPTGALDSETSIQVMEMLKEVANDRLVVMVTHNPELAEEYANRIVRVKDGKILEDSNPVKPEEIKEQEIRHENMGKSSMSMLTALELSANNLKTKKGRTLLTSFAGSIGIIGIALILSLSNGVNTYIEDLQKDTMTAYPITIDANSIDFSSIMMNNMNTAQNKLEGEVDHKLDGVYSDGSNLEMVSTVQTSIKKNNLTDFKNYLDDKTSPIHDFIGENGIVYYYDTQFSVFSYDENDELVNTDGSSFSSGSNNSMSQMMNMMLTTNIMSNTPTSSNNFEALLPGTDGELVSKAIQDNYDLLYGSYPDSYDEVVLVLDKQNELPLTVLYQLGFLPAEDYKDLMKEMRDGKEIQVDTEKLSYSEICNKTFYLVPACDMYAEQEDGLFRKVHFSLEEEEKNEILDHAIELQISGIIRLNEDCDTSLINSAVGYTNALTEYLIDYTKKSDVVKAQKDNEDLNILTGLHFESKRKDEKIEDAKNYISDMGVSEKASMYQAILMMEQLSGKSAPEEETTENTESVQNTPLAAKHRDRSVNVTGLRHSGGAFVSLSQNETVQEITTEEITEPVTEDPTENTGIAIADFSILKTPDRIFYTVGEELDLTGGVIHDSVVILNENGEPEIVDQYYPMTSEEYTLELGNYDSAVAGIYPIYLVKHYINTDGEEDSARVMFYVMISDPNRIPMITDPTEPITETREESDTAVTEPSTSETNITDRSDPTEPKTENPFTMPSMPSLSDIFPTSPNTGNNSNMSDLIQQYLQMQNGTTIPSVGNNSGSMSQQDLASMYAAMMGGGSQQDLSSMYAAMMGSGSQQDLASMYASMMGSGTGTESGVSGSMSQKDLASMYAAMQNGQLPTETTSNGMSQQDLASM
ncbi:MAG: ABC transporter ATP-binding protein, partial [Oscillospiraceae bacterium]|nr:ABC transporter ATP-binding protein [Oscillospiraceae bacterium]